MSRNYVFLVLVLVTAARAAPKIPDPPAEFFPVPGAPAPEACGAWAPGNGTVDRAVADEQVRALAALRHWNEYSHSRRGQYEKTYDTQALLRERVAQWSTAVWATSGRWSLTSTPLKQLNACLTQNIQSYKGKPMDCAELGQTYSKMGKGIWQRLSGSGASERRGVSAKVLGDRPAPKLVRWARRKVGCGLLPERVPATPPANLKQKFFLAKQEALEAKVASDWEAHWRKTNSAEAALLEMRTRKEAADLAAARAKASREAADKAAAERRAAARRAAVAEEARAAQLVALEARARKARPWVLTVRDLDLARAMADVARGDQCFDFRLRDGSTVALRVDQAEALPELSREFGPAFEKVKTYFHLRAPPPNLVPGLVLATARRDRSLLAAISSRNLSRALPRLPPDLARSVRSILSRREKADSKRRAEQEVRAAANRARLDAEAAARAAAYRKAQADAQASMAAWRARQPPSNTGMQPGVRKMHEKWDRSRYEKGVRDGWLKPR